MLKTPCELNEPRPCPYPFDMQDCCDCLEQYGVEEYVCGDDCKGECSGEVDGKVWCPYDNTR
jgi:hypothetical protein